MDKANAVIKSLIENCGPIKISRFMDVALYHKEFGYYISKNPVGSSGDFITAPEISQIFGEIIGIWIAHCVPKNAFMLVEAGPGSGTLMSDIVRVLSKISSTRGLFSVHFVEISNSMMDRKKLSKTIRKSGDIDIFWHKSFADIPKHPMVFVANEFFDALSVDQYQLTSEGWREIMIGFDQNGNYCFQLSNTVEKEFKYQLELQTGSIIEVSDQSINFANSIAHHVLQYGHMGIIVDYGYLVRPLISTLQSVKGHKYNDVLSNIGMADITYHVNFSSLAECFSRLNCQVETQRNFLLKFGAKERVEKLLIDSKYSQQGLEMLVGALRVLQNMGTLFKVLTFNS